MLNISSIIQQYPLSLQEGFEVDILKEYLQYLVLDSIFQSSIGKKMCFIGGTALRLLYDNQRFSEDLDFDNDGISFDEFSGLKETIRSYLEFYNIIAQIVPVQKEAFHLHIKLPDILYDQGLSLHKNQKILIRVDTHNQGLVYPKKKVLLRNFGVGRVINVAPLEVIMAMKIIAISQRKKAKGRDYYDLIFLMNQGVKPMISLLKESLGIFTDNDIKSLLLKHFNDAGADSLYNDVRKFIFNSNDDSVLNFQLYVDQYAFI